MAIGLRIKFDGGTEDQYRAVHSQMNVDADPPDGLIFHSAGPIDGGWGVIDFWESRDAFDRFQDSRLQAALQELGDRAFAGPPDIKQFPVANITKP
jgi:heme-degrading monooxygenase HmoA